MACEHLIAFKAGNGAHHCRDCGVALAVIERDRDLTDYQRAVDHVLTAAEEYVTTRLGGKEESGLAYLNLMEAVTLYRRRWGSPAGNDAGDREAAA